MPGDSYKKGPPFLQNVEEFITRAEYDTEDLTAADDDGTPLYQMIETHHLPADLMRDIRTEYRHAMGYKADTHIPDDELDGVYQRTLIYRSARKQGAYVVDIPYVTAEGKKGMRVLVLESGKVFPKVVT